MSNQKLKLLFPLQGLVCFLMFQPRKTTLLIQWILGPPTTGFLLPLKTPPRHLAVFAVSLSNPAKNRPPGKANTRYHHLSPSVGRDKLPVGGGNTDPAQIQGNGWIAPCTCSCVPGRQSLTSINFESNPTRTDRTRPCDGTVCWPTLIRSHSNTPYPCESHRDVI